MSLTLSDFKASARRRALVLPAQPVVVNEPLPTAAPDLSVRERMERKNPALASLIATLDLEEVSFSLPTEAVAVEPTTPHKPAPNPERLATIAHGTFSPNTCYSADEATYQLSTQTGVSIERATNGLTLMVEQNLLTVLNGIYYLTDSTPF